jgi:hypothetical protein
VRFEGLTAVSMKVTVLRVVASCRPVEVTDVSGTCRLYHQGDDYLYVTKMSCHLEVARRGVV